MVKRLSYSATIEKALGFKPSDHPRKDYGQAAHVVWWVMREAVTDDSRPLYDDDSGRKGYQVTGVSPTLAIKQVWESLALPENKKALNAAYAGVTKAIEAAGAANSVSRGVWWVADTWEAPQDDIQAQEPVAEEISEPAELPTDWGKVTPEHNGKAVPTLTLTEQSVPGDSHADRVAKAVDMIGEVLTEKDEEIIALGKKLSALTAENERLTAKLASARDTLSE